MTLVGVAAVVYVATWTGWLIHHGVYEQRFGLGYGDEAPWGAYVKDPSSGVRRADAWTRCDPSGTTT